MAFDRRPGTNFEITTARCQPREFFLVELGPMGASEQLRDSTLFPPGFAQVDVDKHRGWLRRAQGLQRFARRRASRGQAAMVKQFASWQRIRTGDGIPGHRVHDIVPGFAALNAHADLAGVFTGSVLQPAFIESPYLHGAAHAKPVGIGPNPADEQRICAQGPQVPRHVEGGSAQHAPTVRKAVEQHFAEYADTPAHGDPSSGNSSGW